jgi:hypothetical protein
MSALSHPVAVRIVSAALGIGVALAGLEGTLRLAGYGPWTRSQAFPSIPLMVRPDPAIGWVNREGSWTYLPFAGAASPVHVTIDKRGARGAARVSGQDPVWIFGGSFTFGWGVSDDETYTAVAGSADSGIDTVDLGVTGYGTLQSRLLAERLLHSGAQPTPTPKAVLYGLIEAHEERNLAPFAWRRTLLRLARAHDEVRIPFARLDGRGALRVYPAARYRSWPFASRLALVPALQTAVETLRDRGLESQGLDVTIDLIADWHRTLSAASIPFTVLLLYAPQHRQAYLARLQALGIPVLDLSDPRFPGSDLAIPGNGHPTAALHHIWGRRLSVYLGGWLGRNPRGH